MTKKSQKQLLELIKRVIDESHSFPQNTEDQVKTYIDDAKDVAAMSNAFKLDDDVNNPKDSILARLDRYEFIPEFAQEYLFEIIKIMDWYYEDLELLYNRKWTNIVKSAICYAKCFGWSGIYYDEKKDEYYWCIINSSYKIGDKKVPVILMQNNWLSVFDKNYKHITIDENKYKMVDSDNLAFLSTHDLNLGCYYLFIPWLCKIIYFRWMKQQNMSLCQIVPVISSNNEKHRQIIAGMIAQVHPKNIYVPKDSQILTGKNSTNNNGTALNGMIDFYLPPAEINAFFTTVEQNYKSLIWEFYTKFGIPIGSEGKNQDLNAYSELDLKFLKAVAADFYNRIRDFVADVNELKNPKGNEVNKKSFEEKEEIDDQEVKEEPNKEGEEEITSENKKSLGGQEIEESGIENTLIIKTPDYRTKYERTQTMGGKEGNDNASQKHEEKEEGGEE